MIDRLYKVLLAQMSGLIEFTLCPLGKYSSNNGPSEGLISLKSLLLLLHCSGHQTGLFQLV